MLKRYVGAGLLLGLGALALTVVTSASAYLYKKPTGHDCGKGTLIGGFGGPAPSNVAKNAIPQVHTLIDRGKISCTKAKRVMSAFEKSFLLPGASTKGVSPVGWKCGFSKSLKARSCTNSKHVVIYNAIVYVTPK
ncbi:MAG TPA: hypothetical protein VGX69_08505 [Solirubrobacteraceae bacterium]|jgi:hypothetical protein|nr:hypothetical protein [Solirubrobacteraceae bacterium]